MSCGNRRGKRASKRRAAIYHSILYSSLRTQPTGLKDAVGQIVAEAKTKNEHAGVTGALAATGKSFVQLIEGPRDVVEKLMAKIADDSRHNEIVILRSEPVSQRRLPHWSMAYSGNSPSLTNLVGTLLVEKNKPGSFLVERLIGLLVGLAGSSASPTEYDEFVPRSSPTPHLRQKRPLLPEARARADQIRRQDINDRKAPYVFQLEPELPLLTVTRTGDWSLATVDAYEIDLRIELEKFQHSGRSTAFILDIRSCGPHATDVAKAIASMIARLGALHANRTAVVTSSGVSKLQANRIHDPTFQIFTSMVLARDWVIANADPQPTTLTVHDEPSFVEAEGVAVHVHGPSDVDIALTATAALETARRLSEAAIEVLLETAQGRPD